MTAEQQAWGCGGTAGCRACTSRRGGCCGCCTKQPCRLLVPASSACQLAVVNADNGIIVNGADFVTVSGVVTEFTQPRRGSWPAYRALRFPVQPGLLPLLLPLLLPMPTLAAAVATQAAPAQPPTPPPPPLCAAPACCRGLGEAEGLNGHHALWIQKSSNVLMTE